MKCNGTTCSWSQTGHSRDNNVQAKCQRTQMGQLPTLKLRTSVEIQESQVTDEDGEPTGTLTHDILTLTTLIEYWCELNNCNNELTTGTIEKAVMKYYGLISQLIDLQESAREDSAERRTEKREETTTSTVQIITTTTSTTTTSTRITTTTMTTTTSTTTTTTSTSTTTKSIKKNNSRIYRLSKELELFCLVLICRLIDL